MTPESSDPEAHVQNLMADLHTSVDDNNQHARAERAEAAVAHLLNLYSALYHRHQALRRHLHQLAAGPANQTTLPSPHELRTQHHRTTIHTGGQG